MLTSFRIKNFKSIVDTEINLRYGEGKAPNGYKKMNRLPFLEGDKAAIRTVPVLAIYGQNASGKSTLCDAMRSFCRWMKGQSLPRYEPNKLHPELVEVGTTFHVSYIVNDNEYDYLLTVGKRGVIGEELKNNGALIFAVRNGILSHADTLCSLEYPYERLQKIVAVECVRDGVNTALLSILGSRYENLNNEVAQAYGFLTKNLSFFVSYGRKHATYNFPYLKKIQLMEEAGIFEEISRYVQMLDIDIKAIRKRKRSVEDSMDDFVRDMIQHHNMDTELRTLHENIYGNPVELSLMEESDGTIVLFELIGQIVLMLRTGGVLIADELDRSLHPILLCKLMEFFTSRHYNLNKAQLIFTAHNMEPLDGDILRSSEVGIVTKHSKQGSMLRRICDFDGVRNVKNFRRGYLEGMFSGIPFPYL